ncbi:MAG: PIN domain-containing protein [Actinomycetales bacterium]
MTGDLILDAWAALAYLGGRGSSGRAIAIVRQALREERAVMSWVNLGEVAYTVERRLGQHESHQVVHDLRAAVRVLLPNEATFLQAAHIRATRSMSYADAFAAATAMQCDGELLTGDPELLVPGSPWRWIDLREDGVG